MFVLFVCLSLHAEAGAVLNGSISMGKYVYIADSAKVYGKEHIIVKKDTLTKTKTKKAAIIKEEIPATAQNETVQQEPMQMVFPALPLDSSASSFLQSGGESAAISHQQRIGGDEQAGKTVRTNTGLAIKNHALPLYNPKQRQKLSIAATQCGTLTSFASLSPPL